MPVAAIAGVDGIARDARTAQALLPPDLAFLIADGFRAEFLVGVAAEAARLGVFPSEQLLASGLVTEPAYYRSLARELGRPYLDLSGLRLDPDALDHATFGAPIRAGILPLRVEGRRVIAHAPRGAEIARLFAARDAGTLPSFAIVAPTRARDALLAAASAELLDRAIGVLPRERPDLSAKTTSSRVAALVAILVASVAAMLAVAARAPDGLWTLLGVVGLAGTLLFAAGLWLRARTLTPVSPASGSDLPDSALPTYTVLVALYREENMARQLVEALLALDYPGAKLERIVLVEADDEATPAAIRAVDRMERISIVTVPDGQPRTKPRALQVGLLFARGDLITIFDAEDIPAPRQLRAAAAAFARDPALGCVQAPLHIESRNRSWQERQFAYEYAALFHVLLPRLAARDNPVLLGGTSNHFLARALRGVGGWDPWNVTEDADLGVRLARAGYRIGVVTPPTEEEAPPTAAVWRGQRRRWLKGWFQTALVHFAHPWRLVADLGVRRSLALVALLGGTLVAALVYPVAWIMVLAQVVAALIAAPLVPGPIFALALAVFVAGQIAPAAMIVLGARRAGLKLRAGDIATLPLYWLRVSGAAWAALGALIVRPFHWVKTEHVGRATAQRRARNSAAARSGSVTSSVETKRPLASMR